MTFDSKSKSNDSRNEDVTGLPARRAALKMLDAVLRRAEPLEHAQNAACAGMNERSDRALAVAIAGEVLRNLDGLDQLIDSATKNILDEESKPRMVLRIALAQALVLKTPPHAAISTALPLVSGGPRKLVHGVFGTLMRGTAKLPDTPVLPYSAGHRWYETWGLDVFQAASESFATPPPVDFRIKDTKQTSEWTEKLNGISLFVGHVRAERSGKVEDQPGFDEGDWWVQDLAASIPAALLGEGDGKSVLDLCAAPGGKTMQLAAAGWAVTAIDKSRKRMERLRDNMKRTGLSVDAITADLDSLEPEQRVDAILLDAPCSATGIFRRHPDVLYRIGDEEIATLAKIQKDLLAISTKWLKPGGTFVYAVCSLEKQEGEEQIEQFLVDNDDFTIDAIAENELPAGLKVHENGWVRTLPGDLADKGSLDGFFMVRLTKKI